MDAPLVVKLQLIVFGMQKRLNPYYNGCTTGGLRKAVRRLRFTCLNPYYNGCTSGGNLSESTKKCDEYVLILIIMDAPLVEALGCAIEADYYGLNPYYNGCTSGDGCSFTFSVNEKGS